MSSEEDVELILQECKNHFMYVFQINEVCDFFDSLEEIYNKNVDLRDVDLAEILKFNH